MKYSVGDKVVVKSYQELKDMSNGRKALGLTFHWGVYFFDEMIEYCCKQFKIAYDGCFEAGCEWYQLYSLEDGSLLCFSFADFMLDPLSYEDDFDTVEIDNMLLSYSVEMEK